MFLVPTKARKRNWGPSELELQTVVCYHVGSGNWPWVNPRKYKCIQCLWIEVSELFWCPFHPNWPSLSQGFSPGSADAVMGVKGQRRGTANYRRIPDTGVNTGERQAEEPVWHTDPKCTTPDPLIYVRLLFHKGNLAEEGEHFQQTTLGQTSLAKPIHTPPRHL